MQEQNQTPDAAVQADSAGAAHEAASAGTRSTAPATASEDRIKELETQLAAAKEDFLRAKAETENTRRRAADDIAKAHKFAVESFAEALVPVKDSLDAAAADTSGSVETLKNGVELTIKQLTAAFDKGRVTIIDPAGEKFDPARHQAISMVEADGEANRIVSVLQKGYLIYDRVLRPALVTVSRGKQEQPSA